MEQLDCCTNIDAVQPKVKYSRPRKLNTDRGMKAEDRSGHKLSAPWVCSLLALNVVLSAATLCVAVILIMGNIAHLFKLNTETHRQRESVHSCPDEWMKFNKSCYDFSSSSDSWVEAQRSCASADAHLVVINNAEEQVFLKRKNTVRRWIGLSDSASEGDWRWVDGTDFNSTATLWNKGELNDANSAEDCGEMTDGHWNDRSCEIEQKWICEKPAQ